ncbi:uncharacterized protein LOC107042383 [Diachasma alloeum]|uniref:uncharacterized protein LOC107042383 n=1 Tax=Diachasma alloeum TaxID=454923 RepID=UPI00073827A2|nr:uncharacterized protein LOC107042383 [Diachasma alloeum]
MPTRVLKDDDFWLKNMEPKLIRFYEACVLPEIIDGRKSRGMPIRDPEYITQAKARKDKEAEEKRNKQKAGDAESSSRKRTRTSQKRRPDENSDAGADCDEVSDSEERSKFPNASKPSNAGVRGKNDHSILISDDGARETEEWQSQEKEENSDAVSSPRKRTRISKKRRPAKDTDTGTDSEEISKSRKRSTLATASEPLNQRVSEKRKSDDWIVISDDEEREVEEWESQAVEIIIRSISIAEVIPEI